MSLKTTQLDESFAIKRSFLHVCIIIARGLHTFCKEANYIHATEESRVDDRCTLLVSKVVYIIISKTKYT